MFLAGAKLLHGVEKSYNSNIKLLEESEKYGNYAHDSGARAWRRSRKVACVSLFDGVPASKSCVSSRRLVRDACYSCIFITRSIYVAAEDYAMIPEIIAKGKRITDGQRVEYDYVTGDGVRIRVP